jgi:hypothetical protein
MSTATRHAKLPSNLRGCAIWIILYIFYKLRHIHFRLSAKAFFLGSNCPLFLYRTNHVLTVVLLILKTRAAALWLLPEPITPTKGGSLNMNRSKRIDVTFLPVKQV